MTDICIFLLILACIYVEIYTIYYAISVYFASRSRSLIAKHNIFDPPYHNNIIMVVYCKNDEGDVVSLLEMMNKQDYPKANYQTHIILDNCSDDISNKLEFIGGAKVWRLGDGEPVGKDAAMSWLLERLVSLRNVNAFSFLDSKRKISYDYLSNVNKALFSNDVVVAQTNFVDTQNTLSSKIKVTYNNYANRVNRMGRTIMGLSTIIDSDACAIKQEVIEKIRCIDFKNIESELKYTVLLIKSGFNVTFNPNVVTQLDIKDAQNRKPSPLFRFDMVRHCFGLYFKSRPHFSEFVLYNIKPNIWFLIAVYVFLLLFTYSYSLVCALFDFPVISGFALLLLASFVYSLFVAKLEKQDIKYLLLFPAYRSCKNFEKSRLFKYFAGFIKPKKTFVTRDVLTVDAIVTDGRNNLKCSMDLISEDGLARAVLRYKKKKYTSANQIRMYDAVSDIVQKLDQIGFRIKICHSCGLFTSKIDGSTNMVKGDCLRCKIRPEIRDALETLIWGTCEDYMPRELGKVIDIKDFRNR